MNNCINHPQKDVYLFIKAGVTPPIESPKPDKEPKKTVTTPMIAPVEPKPAIKEKNINFIIKKVA